MNENRRRTTPWPIIIGSAVVLMASTALAQDSPRNAIELYFQAHASGNGDFIRQAFTPDARIEFVDNGQVKYWTRKEFAAKFHGPAADEYRRVRRVESLDVRGTAASAVVTLDYPQVLLRDHLSLLKVGNRWKIVHNVFSAEKAETEHEALKRVPKLGIAQTSTAARSGLESGPFHFAVAGEPSRSLLQKHGKDRQLSWRVLEAMM